MLSVHSLAPLSGMDYSNPDILKDPGGEPGLTAGDEDTHTHTQANTVYFSQKVAHCFIVLDLN